MNRHSSFVGPTLAEMVTPREMEVPTATLMSIVVADNLVVKRLIRKIIDFIENSYWS
jgi:hypothetical protein